MISKLFSRKPIWSYVEKPGEALCAIRINRGPWKGIVYRYGKVKFGSETVAGRLPMKFEYTILDNPSSVNVESSSQAFVNFIGDILTEIIVSEGTSAKKS